MLLNGTLNIDYPIATLIETHNYIIQEGTWLSNLINGLLITKFKIWSIINDNIIDVITLQLRIVNH